MRDKNGLLKHQFFLIYEHTYKVTGVEEFLLEFSELSELPTHIHTNAFVQYLKIYIPSLINRQKVIHTFKYKFYEQKLKFFFPLQAVKSNGMVFKMQGEHIHLL